jgi:ACS family hexuronate transporter-like MFS transporter
MAGKPEPRGRRSSRACALRADVYTLLTWIRRHRRWQIVALLFLFSVVNNLDRQTLSVLAPTMQHVLGFGAKEYSYIVSAFLGAYALGYLFCGGIIDRFGVRVSLALALAFWSVAGGLHALASGWLALAAFRVLLGLGESFVSPAGMKALAEWVPMGERGLSAAIFSNGNTVGAILAPPLISYLALRTGWRSAFIVPACAGMLLLVVWWRNFSLPEDDQRLTEQERQLILSQRAVRSTPQPPTTRELLTHPLCIGFFLMRFLTDPVTYFFAFWVPAYLSHARGFSLALIGVVAWIPFFASDLGGPGGGAISDALIRRGANPLRARRNIMLVAALLMPIAGTVVLVRSAALSIVLLACAFAAQSCWMANQLALISESMHAHYVGRLLALSALGGSVGGMISTLIAGRVITRYGYAPVFAVIGFLHLAGWLVLIGALKLQRRSSVAEVAT